ncbi:MAG TPA: glycoside hydrolase family 3 N-terminal domain-containing protein [Ktedonobacterales bacterium]
MDGEEWQAHRRARGKQAGNGANGSGATNSSRPRRLLAPVLALALIALAACAGPGASGLGARASALVPTPTADAHPAASTSALTPDRRLAAVNARIAHMTLDQELGQLFIVEYLYPDANHTDLQEMIGQMGAGGAILYHYMNIFTIPQMQQLTHAMQAQAAIPLIIGADEEGGGNDQIDQIFGAHPDAWDIGATGDPNVAAQAAARIATELKQLGMNADFAPVVDVEAPSRAWTRSFGRSPDMVGQMGAAQVDAYQARGVMACPKHFPGLGAADSNPHFTLPVITSTRDYIERYDFAPYRALMSHHPAMIMTTDLLMPALDPNMPAELSYPIVTGLLRNEIGYDGVVVTDALYMEGITSRFSMAEAGVLSILAGNDMLEGPASAAEMRTMVDALRTAVQTGRITKARIDDSVRRILLLKMNYAMLTLPPSLGQRDVAFTHETPAMPARVPPAGALGDVRRQPQAPGAAD